MGKVYIVVLLCFFFQAEDGIRDLVRSRGLGDVYKRQHMLDIIRAKAYYSAPANYGAAYGSCWDNEGRERTMGLTIEEIEKVLEERGLLYG